MDKGFTLVETLVTMTLLLLAVLFSARIMSVALNQSRQASLRFHLMEAADNHKHYLSSRPFLAPELAPGSHRQVGQEFVVAWRVEAAAAGLKRVTLLTTGGRYSLTNVFYKSLFIQEVKND
jgi:prepilin-type N-terminal cleavage/methylation domain-containing protein